jgi:hypothetical protein
MLSFSSQCVSYLTVWINRIFINICWNFKLTVCNYNVEIIVEIVKLKKAYIALLTFLVPAFKYQIYADILNDSRLICILNFNMD